MFVFVLFMGLCALKGLEEAAQKGDRVYEGIDLENMRGIDFKKVEQAGIDIVYIPTSYGTKINSGFEDVARRAKEAGLWVGYYHTIAANNEAAAKREAEILVMLVKNKPADCRFALKIFESGNMTPGQATEIYRIFADELSVAGIDVIIYSDEFTAEKSLDLSLTSYPLWLAGSGELAGEHSGPWMLPAGEEYTSNATVAGVKGVKLSRFRSNIFVGSTGAN